MGRATADEPEANARRAAWLAYVSLMLAVGAMGWLHVCQPALDPLSEPVSFYVHGRCGPLLTVALMAFGAVSLLLVPAIRQLAPGRVHAYALIGFGIGMWVTALVPSDEWFPWEGPPSVGGLIHAGAAVVAPPLLLAPMWGLRRRSTARAAIWRRVLGGAFLLGLLASAASLGAGFLGDRSPPLIGLAERALALAAVLWFEAEARRAAGWTGH